MFDSKKRADAFRSVIVCKKNRRSNMKTNEQENTAEGSFEIPERRGTGITGPSREVSQRDQMASCTEQGAEREWGRRHIKDEPAPQQAEQETQFRKPCIGASRESKSTNLKTALVMQEIPLLKIPAALQRGVKEKGGKVYRIGIVRSHLNDYTIKIRCNTKNVAEHYEQLLPVDQLQTTLQSRNTDQTNTTGSSKCGDGP
jgi:hypothetical protein